MSLLRSLQNRVFLASALVALLSIAFALHYVTRRVIAEAEAQLHRGLLESGRLVVEHHTARFQTLTTLARLIADLPKLKAAVATDDTPTVLPVARDYQERVGSDVLLVADRQGRVLAALGTTGTAPGESAAVRRALAGQEAHTFQASAAGVSQRVTVPIVVGPDPPEVLGALSLGFQLDDALASRFKAITGSEIAIAFQGRVWASTLPRSDDSALAAVLSGQGGATVGLGGEEYDVLPRVLAVGDSSAPVALVLRSRSERLRPLRTLRAALFGAALVAVVVAVLLSYGVARTVTRPLRTITARMGEMAATGDLTPRIGLEGRWVDEDARLLARSFNGLTEAIARFQAEAALRERLSALGRLSTVIAHEVRNPLMVIKGSLRALRRSAQPEVSEAAEDIDHEVARLNRIVEDVLGFARPIRLDPSPTDLDELVRDAAAAALGEGPAREVGLAIDPGARAVNTDGERLRTALVNLLGNARDAVIERSAPPAGDEPSIRVATHPAAGGRVVVEVVDRGVGVAPEDLPHLFEPYVSHKRQGTGLGLAITKKIVEALGGTISAESRLGDGTRIQLELPAEPPPQPPDWKA